MKATLSVSAIQDGTVIDHIPAGNAFKIIRLLCLSGNRATVGLNLKSTAFGLKDLIKTENVFLTEAQYAQVAVFAPNATVNIIHNYEVVKKFKVQMPETIAKVLTCANPRCITNEQKIPTLFLVEESNTQVLLRCKYCEKLFSREQIHD
jgi:aspartate carbamoyltransferase regulatory subunit